MAKTINLDPGKQIYTIEEDASVSGQFNLFIKTYDSGGEALDKLEVMDLNSGVKSEFDAGTGAKTLTSSSELIPFKMAHKVHTLKADSIIWSDGTIAGKDAKSGDDVAPFALSRVIFVKSDGGDIIFGIVDLEPMD
jgi:hypothetical protein